MRLTRMIGATGVSLALVCALVSAPLTAVADTNGCVTRKEFGRADDGMRIERVHRIFDTKGEMDRSKNPSTGEVWLFGYYRKCGVVTPKAVVAYQRKDKDSPWRVQWREWSL